MLNSHIHCTFHAATSTSIYFVCARAARSARGLAVQWAEEALGSRRAQARAFMGNETSSQPELKPQRSCSLSDIDFSSGGVPPPAPASASSQVGSRPGNKGMSADAQRAVAIVQQAIDLDKRGDLQQALKLYEDAVGLFLAVAKKESGASQREAYVKAVSDYLTRAETIKASLEVATITGPRRAASVTPTTCDDGTSSASPAAAKGTGGLPKARSVKGPASKQIEPTPTPAPPKHDLWDYTDSRTAGAKRGRGGTARTSSGSGTAGGPGRGGRAAQSASRSRGVGAGGGAAAGRSCDAVQPSNDLEAIILNDMLDKSPQVGWAQIAGLEVAKQTLQEAVVLPNLRPDLFTGLRAPPRGVLLFGPPGTGKTMLAKAVASESGFAFFSISASSLVSKYLGEGEKLVRALFTVARRMQPAVIFMDEIDSILSARRENEHEASRRLKTEFLVQLDGAATSAEDRILVMGATNLPWALDEAVLRRMVKHVYIPLPDEEARASLVQRLLKSQKHSLRPAELRRLVGLTEGYSCSDLTALCKEAAMGPLRDVAGRDLRTIKEEQLRPISLDDFVHALSRIKASVSAASITQFDAWHKGHGF